MQETKNMHDFVVSGFFCKTQSRLLSILFLTLDFRRLNLHQNFYFPASNRYQRFSDYEGFLIYRHPVNFKYYIYRMTFNTFPQFADFFTPKSCTIDNDMLNRNRISLITAIVLLTSCQKSVILKVSCNISPPKIL